MAEHWPDIAGHHLDERGHASVQEDESPQAKMQREINYYGDEWAKKGARLHRYAAAKGKELKQG